MNSPESKDQTIPQKIIRSVVELCTDCDTCRTLMDQDCLFFPELYRLWDQEKESGVSISETQLRRLADLCTLCGLCPCPKIPADIMEAKSRYIDREGLPLTIRLLTDVPRLARMCGTFPKLVNALQSNKSISLLLKRVTHVHPERQLIMFPEQNFFQWAAERGLTSRKKGERNAAYFVGCSAGYLFPQVGRATVEVLERNGVTVYVPSQQCCGMPHLAEGNRNATLACVRSNTGNLLTSIEAGDDLICSCPTCGYFMKNLLKEKAYYSDAYQHSVNSGEDELRMPHPSHGDKKYRILKKSIFRNILNDDGYFSSIDPMSRINLAEQISDAGEYLARLLAEERVNIRFSSITERMVYFAPCHQREQKMGRPYLELLGQIPGLTIDSIGGGIDCCGMGGNFGFKTDFHEKSLIIGKPLMEKIRKKAPQAIITDCMSCRLQFNHVLPYPVFHPMEILARAYQNASS
ncbi:MAG: heterodisulfide reductase-related iron-sulfur binding cluster [Desulfuromonadaceae bacterium]|nr:heterodisulfide reductase-related iron-sulfur binding cluster [Desulfuromonadaceae bacterium]